MIQYWNYLNEYKIEKKNFLYTINKVFNSGTLLLGDELKKFENMLICEVLDTQHKTSEE